MSGGLIQIASYGIHDVFLIGNPQITFFKTVYRKHTHFSMEYLEEQFVGVPNFGNYLSCNISKAGDLLHKIYLKIEIPQVAISKLYSSVDSNITLYDDFLKSYLSIQNYINIVNFNIIQPLYQLLKVTNLKYADVNIKYKSLSTRTNYDDKLSVISSIQMSFNNSFALPLTNKYGSIVHVNVSTNISHLIDFASYYEKYILSTSNTISSDLKYLLDKYVQQLKIIKTNIYEKLQMLKNFNDLANRTNICFAWVEYLGHQIIKRMDIEIGGKTIDMTDSVRSNIHYQLTTKILQDITYEKLIGNVSELTTYNPITKPAYVLYVPIDFWFCRFAGQALPIIYLRYHDVKINLQLNNLADCCYYENLNSDILIEELITLGSVSLIINYIYLDTDERTKFAQLSHEYLINQTQIGLFTNIQTNGFNAELPFFNPIKQLFWVVRNNDNLMRLKYFDYSASYYVDIYEFQNSSLLTSTENLIKIKTTDISVELILKKDDQIQIVNSIYYSGTYIVVYSEAEYVYIKFPTYMKESYMSNYSVSSTNGQTTYNKSFSYSGNSQAYIKKIINANPVATTTLELNGIQRLNGVDGTYSNFVQPYECNTRAPNHGLNTFSFALSPDEYQPSGFCNFNLLDLKTLTLTFNPVYLNETINSSNSLNTNLTNKKLLQINTYADSYNILRFAYGKAGVIFNV